jgi:hypothetical protein
VYNIPIMLAANLSDLANEYYVGYSKLLYSGAFGDVYAATDRCSKKPVAAKLIQKGKLTLWMEVTRMDL